MLSKQDLVAELDTARGSELLVDAAVVVVSTVVAMVETPVHMHSIITCADAEYIDFRRRIGLRHLAS